MKYALSFVIIVLFEIIHYKLVKNGIIIHHAFSYLLGYLIGSVCTVILLLDY